MNDQSAGSDSSDGWKRRRNRRRRRLRERFDSSRRRRHEPPPNPEEWQPEPTWKHVLKTMWDNPLTLVVLAIMIAVLLYLLFPPEWVEAVGQLVG